MTLLDDSWTHGTTAARVFRIVVGVYLIVLLAGFWRRGRPVTAAIVILGFALAASIAGHVMQGLWLRTANREAAATAVLAGTYKSERDSFAVSNAAHVKRAGELESMLRSASSARDEATKETIRIKAERIRSGADDKTAAVEFGSVFGMPILPVLPKAGDSDPGGNDR